MVTINVYDKTQVDDIADAVLPDTTGASEGQVLGLDANLQPAWIDAGGSTTEIDLTEPIGTVKLVQSGTYRYYYTRIIGNQINYSRVDNTIIKTKGSYVINYNFGGASVRYGMPSLGNLFNNSNLTQLPDGDYFILLTGAGFCDNSASDFRETGVQITVSNHTITNNPSINMCYTSSQPDIYVAAVLKR